MPKAENDEIRHQPVVENQAAKPAGILPKNTQAMVVAAISLIMVGAIAFSGSSSSKTATKPPIPTNSAVTDPNQARIAEYRQRLDEQARKLASEQAQVMQAKRQLGTATGNGDPSTGYDNRGPSRTEETSLEDDRKRRDYLSVFASNVALSYRKDNQTSALQAPLATTGDNAQNQLPAYMATPYGYFVPSTAGSTQVDAAASAGMAHRMVSESRPQARSDAPQPSEGDETGATREKLKDRFADFDQSQGKGYRLFEGTIFETVLTNRLTGSFAGPVNCMVTTNVYSHDRQHLLVPQGSRILGEARRVTDFGQNRLAVVFHRLIMPDGYSVSLDQFKGLNQIGETGLRDQVKHHYAQIFGVSLAIGAIAGLAEADTHAGAFQSSTDAYRQGVGSSLSQSSLRILDRYLNVLPTITIREGHRVKIYLSDDLLVPAYENHRMPEDL